MIPGDFGTPRHIVRDGHLDGPTYLRAEEDRATGLVWLHAPIGDLWAAIAEQRMGSEDGGRTWHDFEDEARKES